MSNYPAAMPHGPIEEIANDVFWVQGSIAMGPGMRITRNMTIVRSGEELSVISSVRLSEQGQAELDKLGKVRHVIKIGHAHGVDCPYYVNHYGATYWALAGGPRPSDPQGGEVLSAEHLPVPDMELFEFQHTKEREAALLIKRGPGILITCDGVQNWPDSKGCSPIAKLVVCAMGLRRRPAQISPMWRKFMTPEGSSLRGDFERLVELDFEHLVCAHGRPLQGGARQALRATFDATY